MQAKITTNIIPVRNDNMFVFLVDTIVDILDGSMEGRRFITVGTRIFTDENEADKATLYRHGVMQEQLERDWLNEEAIMEQHGPWRELPTE